MFHELSDEGPKERSSLESEEPLWVARFGENIVINVCNKHREAFENIERLLYGLSNQISCQSNHVINSHVDAGTPVSTHEEQATFVANPCFREESTYCVMESRRSNSFSDVAKRRQEEIDRQSQQWNAQMAKFVQAEESHVTVTKSIANSTLARLEKFLHIDLHHTTTPDTRLAKFVNGTGFNSAIVLAVLINVLWVGFEASENVRLANNDRFGAHKYAMYKSQAQLPNLGPVRHRPPGLKLLFLTVNISFAALFFVELVLKLAALRLSFFIGPGWGMNLLDVAMVLSTIGEFGFGTNVRHGRLARFFRMARVARAIRIISLFRTLRQIVCSIYNSFSMLGWSLVAMLVVMYIFALLIMQFVAVYLENAGLLDVNAHDLADYFGTLESTMVTLFRAVTGGMDWKDVVEPLGQTRTQMKYLFTFYIFIMVFGVMNVLIGVFCEAAAESNRLDPDLSIHREKVQRRHALARLRDMFKDIDVDGDNSITWDEFRVYAANEEVLNYLMAQGLNVMDASALFQQLADLQIHSDTEAGKVDESTFLMVMMRMFGQARSTDLVMLLHETRQHAKLMRHILDKQHGLLADLKAHASFDRRMESPMPSQGATSKLTSNEHVMLREL